MHTSQLKADPRWTAFHGRIPYATAITLLLSVTVFVMSCILGRQLSKASKHNLPTSDGVAPSTVQIIFYEVTTPFLSLIHLTISLFLHNLSICRPSVSLLLSAIFLVGWIIQFSFWANCDLGEFTDGTQLSFCSSWPSLTDRNGSGVLATPLQYARFIVGLLAMIDYLVLVALDAVAVHKGRKRQVQELEMDEL